VRVEVHKARRENTAARVENGRARRCVDDLLYGDDAAVPHEDVASPFARLVYEPPATDDDLPLVCE